MDFLDLLDRLDRKVNLTCAGMVNPVAWNLYVKLQTAETPPAEGSKTPLNLSIFAGEKGDRGFSGLPGPSPVVSRGPPGDPGAPGLQGFIGPRGTKV